MTNKFTAKAQKALEKAHAEACALGHTYIGSEHILLGLSAERDCVASRLLAARGIEYSALRNAISEISGSGIPSRVNPSDMTPRTKRIIESSAMECEKNMSKYIGSEHILYALLCEKDCVAVKIIESLGVLVADLISDVSDYFGVDTAKAKDKHIANHKDRVQKISGAPTLSIYGRDLTALAKEGRIDPVIGRDEETRRVIRILSRRSKNNPCLVGEPGVGKTAVVEGLAKLIADSAVPQTLIDKRIVTLDVPSMIAGAKYRGEFEERMKSVMEEMLKNPDIILFIDEIHVIIGAGAAEGAVDAANILKPALARGEIKIIGATTLLEYRAHIEKDAALERRFQSVNVGEPSEKEAVEILRGLKDKYEAHHELIISDEAIRAAVRLSVRYIPDRYLPDKAIDLIDEAASMLKIGKHKMPPELYETEMRLSQIEREKEESIQDQDFEVAAELRDEEKRLRSTREELLASWNDEKRGGEIVVREEDVAGVVTAWTGIPTGKLVEAESDKLLSLESEMSKKVVGQSEAIVAVASSIRRGRIGLKDEKRPIGSFIFLGSTGVGKTALANALAEALFGSEDAIVRIDMSEYMEKHSISKLIGSPPGYVGYGEGGQLTEKIRRRPYSVVLFDEIEKAHSDVYSILLQILDDGSVSDSQGRRIDFRNTVVIMTSNIGAGETSKIRALGFSEDNEKSDISIKKEKMLSALRREFKPEFLNRVDDIIIFNTLSEENIVAIAEELLRKVSERARHIGMDIQFDKSVALAVAKKSYDVSYGARPLKRTVTKEIEDVISEKYLRRELPRSKRIIAFWEDGALKFKSSKKI